MAINNSSNYQVTQYNVISGGASNALNNIPPSSNTGYALISNGASAQPSFQPIPTASTIIYYLQNTASSVATYLKQLTTPYTPKTTLPFAAIGSGATLLQNWITDAGIPNLASIPTGTFIVHIHADQTVGTRNCQLYAEIWESSATGVDIAKIGTTELTPVLTGAETEYNIAFVLAAPYTMGSTASRVTTRVFVQGAVSGSNATVNIFVGGTADSNLALPSNTVDVSNFVPYTGAVNDVNLGTHSITASSATLTNALTVANGGTGDQSFTAYAPVCGGTTTTNPLQSATTGFATSGFVLTSNGSSALPSFQAAPGSFNPATTVQDFDDFLSTQTSTTTKLFSMGSFGSFPGLPSAVTGHPGLVSNTARTSNTATLNSSQTASFVPGSGIINVNWVVNVNTKSDSTNRYTLYVGLMNLSGTAAPTDGVYFQYSDNVNSGKWQIVTNNGGTPTALDSGTTVVAGTFYNLGVSINAAGTSASFTINGVATSNSPIGSNLPVAAINYQLSAKWASGTLLANSIIADLMYYSITLTTPR